MRQDYSQGHKDALEYLQSMLGQLRTMADAERCEMLAYLIEMAYVEATDLLKGDRSLEVGRNKRDGAAGVPLKPSGKIKLQ